MPADKTRTLFATYAEQPEQLKNVIRLTESLKEFGGVYRDCRIRVYCPQHQPPPGAELNQSLRSLGIDLRYSECPENARWLFYGGKVYAAAVAELESENDFDILVWLDEDTVIIDVPSEFHLPESKALAYCPVMHNRSGSRVDEPPDEYWARIYELFDLHPDDLFEMTTPADGERIRAYFHVGLLAVRPGYGLLRRWAKAFEKLYLDPELIRMCREDQTRNIFLHQTAFLGAALPHLRRDQMVELPSKYNYPIFFERQYGAIRKFDSIENVVTVRHVVSDQNLGPNWHHELAGSPEKVTWLFERLRGSQPG